MPHVLDTVAPPSAWQRLCEGAALPPRGYALARLTGAFVAAVVVGGQAQAQQELAHISGQLRYLRSLARTAAPAAPAANALEAVDMMDMAAAGSSSTSAASLRGPAADAASASSSTITLGTGQRSW
jgi:hypothetical protein